MSIRWGVKIQFSFRRPTSIWGARTCPPRSGPPGRRSEFAVGPFAKRPGFHPGNLIRKICSGPRCPSSFCHGNRVSGKLMLCGTNPIGRLRPGLARCHSPPLWRVRKGGGAQIESTRWMLGFCWKSRRLLFHKYETFKSNPRFLPRG